MSLWWKRGSYAPLDWTHCGGLQGRKREQPDLINSSNTNDCEVLWPTDDDDGRAGQQSEQGEEHHLIAVYEVVQGVAALHTDRRSGYWQKAVRQAQKAVKALKEDPALVLMKQRNTGAHPITGGALTLHGSAGISHVNQSDWDNKSLAIWRAAYGNGGSESCLGVRSIHAVLGETGEASVCLLLHNGDARRRGHHLTTRKQLFTHSRDKLGGRKDGRWEDPYPRVFFCKILNRTGFNLHPYFHARRADNQHGSNFTTSGLYRCQFCAVASSPDISEVKQLWHSMVNTKRPSASWLPTDPSCLHVPYTALFPSKIFYTIKYNFILH